MANLVLYRKYRPQLFSEFIGQEHIVKTITNALSEGLISHSYLFGGPRGTGKTTMARLLAKALNCEKRKGFEPCNKCSSCQEISEGRAMDVIEIDAASHRGIDDIRDLRDGIKFVPSSLKYKVFIIDECHQLSKDASNALLKTLEEPPAHAIFILATTEIHKMIPTIISRCQRFDFRKLKVQEIMEKISSDAKKEGIDIEKTALELIAQNAGGAMRDAEGLLDQVLAFSPDKKISIEEVKEILGLVETSVISQLVESVAKKDASTAIKFLSSIAEKGIDCQQFAESIVNYLRQGLLLKMSENDANLVSGLTPEEIEKLANMVKPIEQKRLSQILENFLEAANKAKYSPVPILSIELAILDSCE